MPKRPELKLSDVPAFIPRVAQPRRPLHPETMSSPTTARRSPHVLRSRNNASMTREYEEDDDNVSDSHSENENEHVTLVSLNESNDMSYEGLNHRYNDVLRPSPPQNLSAQQCSTVQPHAIHNTQRLVLPATKSGSSVLDKLFFWVFYLLLAIAAISVAVYAYRKPTESNIVDELTLAQLQSGLRDDIWSIERDFPAQMRDVWPGFVSGISSVLQADSTVPSIFLLLHDQDDGIVSSCLARRVAQVARRAMNATRQTLLEVSGAAVAGDGELAADWGRFVERYRPLVEDHGVMVLTDLQAVPPDVARSLHSFCDQVTPLVGRAIYIFTLSTSQAAQGSGVATETAERQLNVAWHRLDSDVRQALIVRITSGVVFNVAPELGSGQC